MPAFACFAGAIAFQKGLRAERAFTFGYPRHFVAFGPRGSAPFGVLGFSSFRLVVRGRVAVHLGLPKVSFVRSFVVAGGALHFALPRGFRDARFVCCGFACWLFATSLYDKNYMRNLSRLRGRLLLSINCLEGGGGGAWRPGFPKVLVPFGLVAGLRLRQRSCCLRLGRCCGIVTALVGPRLCVRPCYLISHVNSSWKWVSRS